MELPATENPVEEETKVSDDVLTDQTVVLQEAAAPAQASEPIPEQTIEEEYVPPSPPPVEEEYVPPPAPPVEETQVATAPASAPVEPPTPSANAAPATSESTPSAEEILAEVSEAMEEATQVAQDFSFGDDKTEIIDLNQLTNQELPRPQASAENTKRMASNDENLLRIDEDIDAALERDLDSTDEMPIFDAGKIDEVLNQELSEKTDPTKGAT